MSYDLELFRPERGRRESDDAFEAGPRDAAKEAAKRKLADLLLAHDPQLSETEFDYQEVSGLHRMRLEEVHERLRHIELNDLSTGGSGAQIVLYDDSAAISLPFWHQRDAARRNLERIWGYVEVICTASGYEVFDAQLDRLIGRSAFEDVLARYERAMGHASGRPAPRRRWWQFWS